MLSLPPVASHLPESIDGSSSSKGSYEKIHSSHPSTTSLKSFPSTSGYGQCSATSNSPIYIESDDISSGASDLDKLIDMFSTMTTDQLKYLYSICDQSFLETIECMLEGPSLVSLLKRVRSTQISIPPEESPRIRVEADDDEIDWVQAAVAFYKGDRFLRKLVFAYPFIGSLEWTLVVFEDNFFPPSFLHLLNHQHPLVFLRVHQTDVDLHLKHQHFLLACLCSLEQ